MILKKLMSLKGRQALVTGATGHLGQVISETLAELGANLFLTDLSEKRLKKLQLKIMRKYKVRCKTVTCDLEAENDRWQVLEEVKSHRHGLNILVNNAAFVGDSRANGWAVSLEKQSIKTWRRAMEVNLTAAFQLGQIFSPYLRIAKGAVIINVGSIYGTYGPDWGLYRQTRMGNPAAYAASKGGLLQLTRWLATTLAPRIRVNSISPGGIYRKQPKAFVNRYNARTPLARLATEDDFRGAVAYLASDLSRYVTGQNLSVDGGWGVW